jgi:DNA modification methylase
LSARSRIEVGDCRALMRRWAAEGIRAQTCITSPPYWNLRDYGVAGQIGLEPSLSEWLDVMVEVFDCVRDVLADDGTLWLNIGGAYASSGGPGWQGKNGQRSDRRFTLTRDTVAMRDIARRPPQGLKPKDMMLMPERLAIALQDAGWWVRSRIIWHKCLSGGAWLYARTQKGDMPVMLKDLVRLNPETVSLWNGERWTRVVSWSRSDSDAERLELVLRSGERIGCTGDHIWPSDHGNVEARALRVGDRLLAVRLPDSALKRPPYLTDDVAWLCGLYLAEGSRSDDTVQIALHADESDWLARINNAAEQLGATMTTTIKGNTLSVRLYGRVLVAAVESIVGGRVAKDKHLRPEVWRLPNSTLRAIIEGYLDGDGHADGDRVRLGFCRNYALERDLRTAAARLGATLTLTPGTSRFRGRDWPAFRGEWRWMRSGHHNERDRNEIVEIRRSRARQFWDVTVEDEPHLFALASGVLTHNCNLMPESVTDRPTKAHEHIWLLAKSEVYYYDAEAIKEPASPDTHARRAQWKTPDGWDTSTGAGGHGSFHREGREDGFTGYEHKRADGQIHKPVAGWATGDGDHKPVSHAQAKDDGDHRKMLRRKAAPTGSGTKNNASFDAAMAVMPATRNKRDVWTIPTQGFPEAHFATFPEALVEPCILAGSRPGDIVLDPFGGSGTTARVAHRLGRRFLLAELNPEYAAMAERRVRTTGGLAL